LLSRPPHQSFIRITAAAAQAMIEMRDPQLPFLPGTQSMQQMQQHHRVQSPGNSHQNGLAPTQEPAGKDGLLDERN
jgi:hypothetical protein